MTAKSIVMAAAGASAPVYVEDVFSTWLYTANAKTLAIPNGMPLTSTAKWSTYGFSGGSNAGIGRAVATDSSGNFYVAGYYESSSVYANIIKYNSAGVVQWQRKFVDSGIAKTYSVTVDSSGNVYITGEAQDNTRQYAFIAKYNSSGTIQWQRKFYDSFADGHGIAVDSSGNVYVAGRANDGTTNYAFIAKYNSSGTIQWQRYFYQGSQSRGQGVSIDSSGNVYVAGTASDITRQYAFVAKYNSSGTLQWQRKFYEGGSNGNGVAVDSSGNVYITGDTSGANYPGFVAKYNSSGTLQWQRYFSQGNSNSSSGSGISIDSSSNVYITGYTTRGGVSVGFIAKYNSSGAIQWQRNFANYYLFYAEGYSISADSSGNVYTTGYSHDPVYAYEIANTIKLAQDGSTESGTAIVNLFVSNLIDSAGTATDDAGTATEGAGTATDAAGTATDSAGDAETSSATQAAVIGKGGMVWVKKRSATSNNNLKTTQQGINYGLSSNATDAQFDDGSSLLAFNSNGFTLGNTSSDTNEPSGATYASWTFTEQPKFFDIVTWTGNGANRTIAHNLGSVPGCIIVKRTDTTSAWAVYHRSLANTDYLVLNTTAASATGATYWNSTTATSTVFSLGTATDVNANGGTYIAYLFAHDAGGFGLTGTDNVISCGSLTTNGSGIATVNLGYEPQWLLYKRSDSSASGNWFAVDTMRGFDLSGIDFLNPNLLNAETPTGAAIYPTATGFNFEAAFNATYIYIAIRRGPMKAPTSGTSVYAPATKANTSTNFEITFSSLSNIDALISWKFTNWTGSYDYYNTPIWNDRLRGFPTDMTGATWANNPALASNGTDAEATGTGPLTANWLSGVVNNKAVWGGGWSGYTGSFHAFLRAPGFFDVVCYTGTGATLSVNHNLGVVPELIIFKRRDSAASWPVWRTATGTGTTFGYLNDSSAEADQGVNILTVTPTSTAMSVGAWGPVNGSGGTYVAYLFASCPGVSKVGSYTGTGTTKQIDCGFTGGARFVLIKRTDSTGDWYVWNSATGIVSGNDPYLLLNSNAAEVSNTDYIDTYSAGFEISSTAPAAINASGGTYIYLAIA